MVELLHRERTIKVKIVYYGPPVGGKTTNLQVLHQHALAARKGEMVSVNSAQDRTILFDLLPLRTTGFRGYDVRLQVLAVPGQGMYAATRRLVLKGTDALVFVANSAADRWEENIQSFREMTQNLLAHQLEPASIPLVLQYNKRDLPDITPFEFMDRAMNARKVDAIPAVAVRGEGVLETFSAILMRTLQDLSSRYQIVDPGRGQNLAQWTQNAVQGMFGTTSLAIEPNPVVQAEPPPGFTVDLPDERPTRRTVRVALPEDAVRMAAQGPDARANETLVESYAQASQQLGLAMTDLREERDLARQRLADIQAVLAAAQEVLDGQPLLPMLRGVLMRMVQAARATGGTFLLPEGDKAVRAPAELGFTSDPLLQLTHGQRLIASRFLGDREPRLHSAAENLDLGDALEFTQPPIGAVASVPVRTPRDLQGLALLYYATDASLPRADELLHLGLMARTLAAPLELAQALETVRGAERSLDLATAGTASARGLEDVVVFLGELRDLLGQLRRRADAPRSFQQEFAGLAPLLSDALATARSLAAFSKGEVEREALLVSELVQALRLPGLQLDLGPGAEALSGDAALLRLALRVLVDEVRAHGGPQASLRVETRSEAGRLRLSVAGAPGAPDPGHLGLVQRIAELHGGQLRLDTDLAGAPRFSLFLTPA